MIAIAPGVRAFAMALVPVALVLSHRNLVAVLALVGLTGAAGLWRMRGDWRRIPVWAGVFLALAGYLAVSSLWTPSEEDRDWIVRIPAFTVLIGGALIAAREAREWEAGVFAVGVIAACLMLGAEGLTGGGLRDLLPPQNASDRDDVSTARGMGLAVVLLPAGLACLSKAHRTRITAFVSAIAIVALAIGTVRFDIAANALAYLAAGVFAALATWRARTTLVVLLGLFAAAFVALPIAAAFLPDTSSLEALGHGPVSWRQRLVIWRTVADATLSSLGVYLFGAGQHASAALGEAAGSVLLAGADTPLPRVPTHPHNVFLAVAYEAGALGCALAASGFALAARAAGRAQVSGELAVGASAVLGASLVFWLVDASLWTLWRSAAGVLATYGLILAARHG